MPWSPIFLPRDLALGEDGRDLVGVLDLLGVHAQQVAGGHDLLEREVLGVDHVEGVGLRDDALGHVVGRDRDVLDRDAGVGLDLLGDVLSTGSPRCRGSAASPAPGAMHGREAGDGRGASAAPASAARALQDVRGASCLLSMSPCVRMILSCVTLLVACTWTFRMPRAQLRLRRRLLAQVSDPRRLAASASAAAGRIAPRRQHRGELAPAAARRGRPARWRPGTRLVHGGDQRRPPPRPLGHGDSRSRSARTATSAPRTVDHVVAADEARDERGARRG